MPRPLQGNVPREKPILISSRAQASLSTRTTTPEVLDAGLSGQSSIGQFDVGLCVRADAIGVILSAPRLGILKLALDVTADGTPRLTRAVLCDTDGPDRPIETQDSLRVRELEAEIERLKALLPPPEASAAAPTS